MSVQHRIELDVPQPFWERIKLEADGDPMDWVEMALYLAMARADREKRVESTPEIPVPKDVYQAAKLKAEEYGDGCIEDYLMEYLMLDFNFVVKE